MQEKLEMALSHVVYIEFFFESTQIIQTGIIRGMGLKTYTIIGGCLSYFFVSSPLRWFIAFNLELGMEGLWYGMLFGFGCLCLFY